ncbi:MAG: aldo/keto reductase [Actinomycetota bacterium]|nr:aldo/keto reductase [Actinomycetota bacterium]
MSAIDLPALGYGAANIGNLYRAMSDQQADDVLDAAWESGIRYFDTAPHYGLGLSERRLGAFLQGKPRGEFVLSTKVGRRLLPNHDGAAELDLDNHFVVPATLRREWDFTPDGVRRSVEESLQRLGLDRVDIVYLHDPDRFDLGSALASGIPAAAALRDEGVVSAIGVGSMDTAALQASVDTGALDLLMLAGRYTLLEQPAEEGILPACQRHSTGVVLASVFNSGLLARDTLSSDARYEYGPVPVEIRTRHAALVAICHRHGIDIATAALQFGPRHPAVHSVVAGAADPAQIRQTAARMAAPVPDAFWTELAERRLISVESP